jgi:hypothetical protein
MYNPMTRAVILTPHNRYRMYNPMTRAVTLAPNVTWAAWEPGTSRDTLEHIFEMDPDGIACPEDNIKDIAWANSISAPHVIPDNDTNGDLAAERTTQPNVEMIPAHFEGRRNGDRASNNGDSEDSGSSK